MSYLWGPDARMTAANEFTGNIAGLAEIAPGISSLSKDNLIALKMFRSKQIMIKAWVEDQGRAYNLLCAWMEKVHCYAEYTRQMAAVANIEVDFD